MEWTINNTKATEKKNKCEWMFNKNGNICFSKIKTQIAALTSWVTVIYCWYKYIYEVFSNEYMDWLLIFRVCEFIYICKYNVFSISMIEMVLTEKFFILIWFDFLSGGNWYISPLNIRICLLFVVIRLAYFFVVLQFYISRLP